MEESWTDTTSTGVMIGEATVDWPKPGNSPWLCGADLDTAMNYGTRSIKLCDADGVFYYVKHYSEILN
jgi:hypothetical protein